MKKLITFFICCFGIIASSALIFVFILLPTDDVLPLPPNFKSPLSKTVSGTVLIGDSQAMFCPGDYRRIAVWGTRTDELIPLVRKSPINPKTVNHVVIIAGWTNFVYYKQTPAETTRGLKELESAAKAKFPFADTLVVSPFEQMDISIYQGHNTDGGHLDKAGYEIIKQRYPAFF